LPKRLTEEEKHQLIQKLLEGENIDFLSKEYSVTKVTINRNLKKFLGNKKFEEFLEKIKVKKKLKFKELESLTKLENDEKLGSKEYKDEESAIFNDFTELTPLYLDIDNEPQRDLSSIDINLFDFPKMVYMIVNKEIELETKSLRDFPQWQFLSMEDLNRKTFEIFFDMNIAKRACKKDQKVLKVPNPNVFKLVAPILCSRGISRIVCPEKLIAL